MTDINMSYSQVRSLRISDKIPVFFYGCKIRLLSNSEVQHLPQVLFLLTNNTKFLETGTALKALIQTSSKTPPSPNSRDSR